MTTTPDPLEQPTAEDLARDLSSDYALWLLDAGNERLDLALPAALRRAIAAETCAAALERELERHAITCGWPRDDDLTQEEAREGLPPDIRRIHRSLEQMIDRACKPGLSPKERGERLLVAWRNWLGAGGIGIGSRLGMAEDVRRVVEAAVGPLERELAGLRGDVGRMDRAEGKKGKRRTAMEALDS